MAFLDVSFPTLINLGSPAAKPAYDTVVVGTGRYEQRIALQANPRRMYRVDLSFADEVEMAELVAFVSLAQGKLNSFRFKDWSDYTLGGYVDGSGFHVDTPVEIGTGDAATTDFQIKKSYTYGASTVWRDVTKPVSGTVTVYLDSVLQSSGYTVDYSTGVVTFSSAPGVGVVVTVACEFDVPCRLDTDEPEFVLDTVRSGNIASISLVEVAE